METSFTGAIKSWNPEKGWGFIECPQTHQMYGKDIFLLRSALEPGCTPNRGEMVSFGVGSGTRGPEAVNVVMMGPGFTPYVAPKVQTVAPVVYVAPPAPVMNPGGQGLFVGFVKSFRPESGWGHISCDETNAIFGKDIFFMKSQVPGGIIAGTQVRFSVAQGLKGPEAANIEPLGDCLPNTGLVAAPTTVVGGSGFDEICYGTLKSFNEERGWGHIDCAKTRQMYSKDIFVLRSALLSGVVTVGEPVRFNVVMGKKGPEAACVVAIKFGVAFVGSVKSWNAEKGWGYIECPEARDMFGRDIFLHRNKIGAHNPTPGDQLQFTVDLSEKGRPEGTNVVFGAYGALQRPRIVAKRVTPY
mmetsp:Transcript_27712/g.73131  ORF Transcript_27712/g.73131 Transcript_27712/m.73131 type:complete len:357 (-) Transcript_27712:142-1212(-)